MFLYDLERNMINSDFYPIVPLFDKRKRVLRFKVEPFPFLDPDKHRVVAQKTVFEFRNTLKFYND
ncbi:hypothetical protein LEP1GSC051_4030 [Leptospira sp. P2653]|nr:hypothetical protein LEP1GSC051_4030 [Leptospira sp. P2653]